MMEGFFYFSQQYGPSVRLIAAERPAAIPFDPNLEKFRLGGIILDTFQEDLTMENLAAAKRGAVRQMLAVSRVGDLVAFANANAKQLDCTKFLIGNYDVEQGYPVFYEGHQVFVKHDSDLGYAVLNLLLDLGEASETEEDHG